MKSIELLSPTYSPYGIEIIEKKLKQAMEKKGSYVEIVKEIKTADSIYIPISISCCVKVLKSKISNNYESAFIIDSPSLAYKSVICHSLKYKVNLTDIFKLTLLYIYYSFWESRILSEFKQVIVVSEVDKRYLINKYNCPEKVLVVKNGVDIPTFYNKDNSRHEKVTLGFISSFSDGAFKDINWFLDKIWSRLPVNIQNRFEILIAGRNLGGYKSELETYNNVRCLGEVNSLSEYYSKIDISLTTVRKTCGILNKVLESWSYEVPVIGLQHNFQTLQEFSNEKHYLCFDNLEEAIKILNLVSTAESTSFDLLDVKDILSKNYDWDINYSKLIQSLI
ncbi:glycosyltransferase family 4 protein [Psychromonas arctica]|uniref:glycosyltransferase family 4 protein n=1 Tax=Psychromonas arctica TaxID=168275 RepID=UPI0003FD8770|nr:glycosyltransferase family 4 protein [Psychromonas arctica]